MAQSDQARWDERYRALDVELPIVAVPAPFAAFVEHFPRTGRALDVACGRGSGAVWLAQRGLVVEGYDISPVAVELARSLAELHQASDGCSFETWDLDDGLPPGDPVDVLLCSMFREPALDQSMIERLRPGGLLAIAVLSEVGAEPGRFRATKGQLLRAFAGLDVLEHHEADGVAMLLGRAKGRSGH